MQDNPALILEISLHQDTLKLSIFEKGLVSPTLKSYSHCPFLKEKVNQLCQELVHILNKLEKNKTDSSLILELKKIGKLLWEHLFSRQIKDRLKTTIFKDLILFLDEELIYLPWELLYTGEDFLCLKFNLGRMIMTKDKTASIQYRSLTSFPLKMLILSNPTQDLKSAYQEGLYIKNAFDRKRDEIKIDFKSTYIDNLYVKKNLGDYDIVHFAGHAEFEENNPKNTGWVLSDGRFTAEDILSLGESFSLPSLIFSNACYSAKVSPDFWQANYQEKTYSLASAFLFSGVRHYIGTLRNIEDKVSLIFAKEFYNQLLKGESLGKCLRLGRLKLIHEFGINQISWMNYILYGDPSFSFFKVKRQPLSFSLKRKKISKKLFYRIGLVTLIILIFLFLNQILPTLNPKSYYLFLKSRNLFLKGKNEEALVLAEIVLKKDPLFVEIYPLLAEIYQRDGKINQSLKYYFDYARLCEKRGNKKNLTSAYLGIGWLYQIQGKYNQAKEFYEKALYLSQKHQDKFNEAVALRKLALWYNDKEDYDKALELLIKSSEINRLYQNLFSYRYNLACDYFDLALVFSNKDDYKTAKDFYQKSRALFEKLKLKTELADYYFNLGEISLFEKEYQKALEYYLKGLKIHQIEKDLFSLASDYNMLGELYKQMGNLFEAERYFKETISLAKNIEAPLELAEAYYNLGLIYKEKNQKDLAKEYLKQAGQIYQELDTADYQRIKKEVSELE